VGSVKAVNGKTGVRLHSKSELRRINSACLYNVILSKTQSVILSRSCEGSVF